MVYLTPGRAEKADYKTVLDEGRLKVVPLETRKEMRLYKKVAKQVINHEKKYKFGATKNRKALSIFDEYTDRSNHFGLIDKPSKSCVGIFRMVQGRGTFDLPGYQAALKNNGLGDTAATYEQIEAEWPLQKRLNDLIGPVIEVPNFNELSRLMLSQEFCRAAKIPPDLDPLTFMLVAAANESMHAFDEDLWFAFSSPALVKVMKKIGFIPVLEGPVINYYGPRRLVCYNMDHCINHMTHQQSPYLPYILKINRQRLIGAAQVEQAINWRLHDLIIDDYRKIGSHSDAKIPVWSRGNPSGEETQYTFTGDTWYHRGNGQNELVNHKIGDHYRWSDDEWIFEEYMNNAKPESTTQLAQEAQPS